MLMININIKSIVLTLHRILQSTVIYIYLAKKPGRKFKILAKLAMKDKDGHTQGVVDETLLKQLMNLNIHKDLGWQPHEIKLGSRWTHYLQTVGYYVMYWFVAMVILIGVLGLVTIPTLYLCNGSGCMFASSKKYNSQSNKVTNVEFPRNDAKELERRLALKLAKK